MANVTDPARELGEIATKLTVSSSQVGSQFLAKQFGVAEWSTDFMRIVACIMERADLVARIVRQSEHLDDDHKDNAIQHLAHFKAGFVGGSLNNHWNTSGHGLTAMKDHGGTIQFLSQTVRPVVKYPKLTESETAEFIEAIDQYLAAVGDSDEGPAFVRQAIIDGLTAFRFQLDMLGWMGSGYALSAFREVVEVYEMSRSVYDNTANLDAEAVLGGLYKILKSFKTKVDEAKGWKDAGESVWNLYGVASRIATPLLLTGQFPALPST